MICNYTGKSFLLDETEKQILNSIQNNHPLINEQLPPPNTNPNEFMRRICNWGNLLTLFKNKSSFSNQNQLSRYNPELGYKICTTDEFWTQKIDNIEFGKSYDFTKPFFSQINELLKTCYLIPLSTTNCEGSEYINGAHSVKNSYLSFGIFKSEDCMYSYMLRNCSDCLDCINLLNCQFCYGSHTLKDCYECKYCNNSNNCSECIFCEDCIGCNNCILSFGLRNQTYCIKNTQVTKEEYQDFVKKLGLHQRNNIFKLKKLFKDFIKNNNYITNTISNSEASTGEYLINVNNVNNSFYVNNAKDCSNLLLSNNCTSCSRGFAETGELSYQSGVYQNAYCTYNSYMIVGGSYNLYSLFMYNSCNHCFGCIGLNKKSYCILNKQYTKEEYYELVPRIINHMKSTGEWGDFFPNNISPHYYETTFCKDWLTPIDIKEASKRGFRTGYLSQETNVSGKKSTEIPNSILDMTDQNLQETYVCYKSGEPYKIQKKELDFYNKFNIPVPDLHWRERIRSLISDNFLIPN